MVISRRNLVILLLASLAPSCAWAALSIPLTVTMSETVTVDTAGGTPRIPVNVGGNTRYATYTSGSGTNALTFTLTPTAGDVDLDGIAVSSPVDLNGGTIKDVFGNAATLTFTAPNTSGIKVDYPSLSMDFIGGDYILSGVHYASLPSFLTAVGGSFTRASIGTYYDSSGTLQTAASGVPRFDYDPVTHVARGLLIEESKINVTRNSGMAGATASTLPTYWSFQQGNGLTGAVVGIGTEDGLSYVDIRFSGTATAAKSLAIFIDNPTANASASNGQTWTSSAYIKLQAGSYSGISTSRYLGYQIFDNTTTYLGDSTGITFTATNAPLRTQRYVAPGVISKPTAAYIRQDIVLYVDVGSSVDITLRVAAPQLEPGAFATSFIPTTGTTVTRAADILSMPTGGWYSAASSTFLAEAYGDTNTTQAYRGRWIGANSGVVLGNAGALNNIETWTGTAPSINTTFAPSVSQSSYTAVDLAWDTAAGTRSLFARGGTLISSTIPGAYGFSTIYIGSHGSGNFINAPIRRVRYYPLRAADSQLQLLAQ